MFQKAQRHKAKLRLGLTGAAGSGKTWSALEIATGMGGKIAMIDTESGRGELYGEDFNYDVLRIDAPYSPEKYIDAIKVAEQAGYDTLIIDSMSHAWVGEGGILSIVDKAGNNSFTSGWRHATPRHDALVNAIINSKLHIIITLRSKVEWVIEDNEKGKKTPKKVGTTPVQRDGLEYEFTIFANIGSDHVAYFSKDNTKLFDNQYIKVSHEIGKKIIDWLNNGIERPEPVVDQEEKTFSLALDRLEAAENLEELKNVYEPLKEKYLGSKYISNIVAAKDKRKAELMGGA